MINKKAQGISVNVIIIAAIALIILVVLVAVFTGRFGIFSKGLGESTTCAQACKAAGYTKDESKNRGTVRSTCENNNFFRLLPGRYPDVERDKKATGSDLVCCCYKGE